MSNCPYPEVPEIFKTECIGNSLAKINSNFSRLREYACDNYSEIVRIDNEIESLTTIVDTLSSYLIPGIAKAWVKFDGTRNENNNPPNMPEAIFTPTDRFIYSSYNVRSVTRSNVPGEYQINFQAPFTSRNYLLVGTSSQKQATTGVFTWLQPTRYETAFAIVRVLGTNIASTIDAEHISVAIY